MRHLFLNKRQIIVCACIFVVVLLHAILWQVDDASVDTYVYQDYAREYQEYRKRVEQRYNNNKEISIFRESDSIALANAEKTIRDYARSAEIEIVPLHGAQNAVAQFVAYEGVMVASCVVVLFLIFDNYLQKESTMRMLEFSLPRGRRLLALLRTSNMLGSACLVSFLLQIAVMITCFCRFGGWQDLSAPIQSVPMFITSYHTFSIAQFLVAYCGVRAIAIGSFGILFLSLLWLLDHKILTVFFWVLFLIGESLMYYLIPMQGRWNGIKLFNVIYLLIPEGLFLTYRNIKTPFGLLELKELYVWLIVCCFAVGISVIVWVSGKRSLNVVLSLKNKTAHLINIVMCHKATLEQKLSWILMEIYGFFILQKGWIICVIFMALIVFQFQKDDIVYAGESKYLQAFYQEWEGPMTEELVIHMEEWEEELSQVESAWQKITEAYVSGEISFDEYDNKRYWYESYQVPRNCYAILSEQIGRIEELEKNTGTQMWLVNEAGYGYLLDKNYANKQMITEWLVYILVMLSCISIIRGKELMPYNLQRAFPLGRIKLYVKKMVANMLVILVFGTLSKMLYLLYVNRSYGLSAWRAPVQSLGNFFDSTFAGNILAFYILRTLGQIGSYMALGCVMCFLLLVIRGVKK